MEKIEISNIAWSIDEIITSVNFEPKTLDNFIEESCVFFDKILFTRTNKLKRLDAKQYYDIYFNFYHENRSTQEVHKYIKKVLFEFYTCRNIVLVFKDNSIPVRIHIGDLLELLNWLKLIGANRYWPDRFYQGLSGRCFIDTITKKYEKRFRDSGKVFATFEVLFVQSVK